MAPYDPSPRPLVLAFTLALVVAVALIGVPAAARAEPSGVPSTVEFAMQTRPPVRAMTSPPSEALPAEIDDPKGPAPAPTPHSRRAKGQARGQAVAPAANPAPAATEVPRTQTLPMGPNDLTSMETPGSSGHLWIGQALPDTRREPFQARIPFNLPQGDSQTSASVQVPAHKRLVIEYASVHAGAAKGQQLLFLLKASLGDEDGMVEHALAARRIDEDLSAPYSGSIVVRAYAAPGSLLGVLVRRSGEDDTSARGAITISGYVIDAP